MAAIKNNLGVTSIELLIVVVIIAVLTAVAVPSFNTFLQNHRLTMTADNLFVAMQHARSEAIKRNATIYVTVTTGDSWCYGYSTASGCNCATAGSCNIASVTAPAAQQITFSTTSLNSNTFQIEGSRGATNVSNAKITMTVYGQATTMSVVINQLGDFQICSSSISGYMTCP